MPEVTSLVFCYKSDSFCEVRHEQNDTCEDVCKKLCQRLQIAPLVQLLFGLRIHGKICWLPGCRVLSSNVKYEFRVRFKVPKLSDLQTMDKITYDYFYHQVRFDVLHNNIPEIEYPKYKNEIMGLCVTDMYVEMIEKNKSVDDLKKNYKNYIPKELAKNHSIFAKKKIENSLKSIKNTAHDVFYVKGIYIQHIDAKAPNYLTEEYVGQTPYLREDQLKEGNCPVRLRFSPFHPEEPGLRIFYAYKNLWKHISKIADFYTITIDESAVSLEIQNNPLGFTIAMDDKEQLESFVSCICGYYRLMVKWNFDLCQNLGSPALKFLTELKCHGPIGGAYSYNKIEEKNGSIGSFIVRQCEKVFDTYYIDIVTKENQPETFKILYKPTKDNWHLVHNEKTEVFDKLIDLAKSIQTNSNKFRLPPTQHDKSPLLLLCLSQSKLTVKEQVGPKVAHPLILRAADDLLIYKWSQKEYGDGMFTRMKAEYKQSHNKKLNVTLKILKLSKVENRLVEFMQLADKWAKLDLSEIVKLHGLTLCQPIAMVLESIPYGPLDEFLQNPQNKIKTVCLVETAYSLAKALHYLQENQITHGKIRCSSLQVTHFETPGNLVVKLGDPGLPTLYTMDDIYWIPIENYENKEEARKNFKGDIWAYATTLWEIFSRGATPNVPNPVQFFQNGERLIKPFEANYCPVLYEIMIRGWDAEPDRRFAPQNIFSRLLGARTELSRDYEQLTTNGTTNGSPSVNKSKTSAEYSNNSLLSNQTYDTYVGSNITTAYMENSCHSISTNSHDGSSQLSLLNGQSPTNGSQNTIAANLMDFPDEYMGGIPEVVEMDSYRLIFQGEIGRGNYGSVFRGLMESCEDNSETQVALKMFRIMESETQFKDFQREAKIMKTLKHENIVKIYGFLDDPKLLIIMEYMQHGSLLAYCAYARPNLTETHLLKFAKNIASGMQYLESMKIVHRDLAARNVLVLDENCVKIADFGLAQFTDNTGYYHFSTKSRALPLKWYAPETLQYSKFSHKSDVWSYGVTLFEMFSFGESPNLQKNADLNANEILQLLENNQRLDCPPFCQPNIYQTLMEPCWCFSPKTRPSFNELLKFLDELINVNGEDILDLP